VPVGVTVVTPPAFAVSAGPPHPARVVVRGGNGNIPRRLAPITVPRWPRSRARRRSTTLKTAPCR